MFWTNVYGYIFQKSVILGSRGPELNVKKMLFDICYWLGEHHIFYSEIFSLEWRFKMNFLTKLGIKKWILLMCYAKIISKYCKGYLVILKSNFTFGDVQNVFELVKFVLGSQIGKYQICTSDFRETLYRTLYLCWHVCNLRNFQKYRKFQTEYSFKISKIRHFLI